MEDIKVLNTKSRIPYFSSLIFLGIVLLGTIATYFYDSYLSDNNTKLLNSINEIESNIKDVEKDKNIQIYSLLQINKDVISKYEAMNHVTKFINHLNTLKTQYNLEFIGFDLSDGKITSEVKVISDDNGIAFQKARDFISKYRLDTTAMFDLLFISAFDGMDEIKFKVDFKIK